jgi:hypothetical protein
MMMCRKENFVFFGSGVVPPRTLYSEKECIKDLWEKVKTDE